MSSLTRMFAGVALAASLIFTASAALAAPGNTLSVANVRSGPGTNYRIVATLPKGRYVVVVSCGANWCLIHQAGLEGYISRKLLINPYYSTGAWRGFQFPPTTMGTGR